MISTFHGLETSRRALTASQGALYTTGHNIANANTPGYSRQRVNLVQGEPFPNPGMNRPAIPGQLGTGVKVDSIQRYREAFLDAQFRGENSKQGYWDARFVSLQKMEDIMNEPSPDGIAASMDRFWNALQDLSVHPEDSGARSVVRQRGYALAETFNYVSNSLKTVQTDLMKEIEQTERDINTILRQINSINFEISKIEPHGYVTNDLYDRRDLLVDQLSQYMNIKVTSEKSKGMPSPVAEGIYTITLVDKNGNPLLDEDDAPIILIDGKNPMSGDDPRVIQAKVRFDSDYIVDTIAFGTMNAAKTDVENEIRIFGVDEFATNGKLKGQVEAYGYNGLDANGDPIIIGLYPEMLEQLDIMVVTFVEELNKIHRSGSSLIDINNGTKLPPEGLDFFLLPTSITLGNPKGAASSLKINPEIQKNLDNIAASGSTTETYEYLTPPSGYKGLNPSVRGVYSGAEGQLQVKYNNVSGEWEIGLDGVLSDADVDDDGNINFNGLTINVTNINPTADRTWILEVTNGYKPEAFTGDGSNARALANVKDKLLTYGGSTTSVHSFYQGVIGDMAVNTNEADRMKRNSETLRATVDERRMSVSSVSLDEEFTNMIKFQHAYNAAARNITNIDDMLDRIINRMGRAGL